MNCALIDDDDDDNDCVAVVVCAVDADGIMSMGMHEKRGKKTRTAEKGHDAALWLMMEVGEVSGGRRDNNTCSPKDKNSAKASLL
jgi:hypothetical protein